MDMLHRKTRYQKVLTRLHKVESESAASGGNQEIYASIQDEVNQMIESLRSRGDQSNAKTHFILLGISLLIVLIWHSIVTGSYLSNSIILLLCGAALAISQYRMKQVIQASQDNAPRKLQQSQDLKEFITLKMRYLDTAMDIKKARLLLVALFYILFCPILLVKLHEAALGSTPFDSTGVAYLIAYLLGAVLWFIYFNRCFEVYDDIEDTMGYISSKLETLA